jgi:hypothetical protein
MYIRGEAIVYSATVKIVSVQGSRRSISRHLSSQQREITSLAVLGLLHDQAHECRRERKVQLGFGAHAQRY